MNISTDFASDIIKDILRTIRVDGSLFFHSELVAPWGVVLPESNEPKIHIVLFGECVVQSDTMENPVYLKHGDTILLPDGAEHWLADNENTPRLTSDRFCKSVEEGRPGVKLTGPSVQLLCGLIRFDRSMTHPLIKHLPASMLLRYESSDNGDWLGAIISQFVQEIRSDTPFSDLLADRLFELLFLQIIRHQMTLINLPRGFCAALRDSRIAKALQLIHERFAENLSIEYLANEIYLSRSVFIERFTRLVGESPISYLTTWRMHRSISLIRGNGQSIVDVAEQVGYSSAESFSRAFKRYFGITPLEARDSS